MVQWLRLHTSNAGGMGSIPGWGTKIPCATQQKKKKKEEETSKGRLKLFRIKKKYNRPITRYDK